MYLQPINRPMGKGSEGKTHGKADVRDRLVHSIYALVDNDDEWPNLLHAMDEFFDHEDNDPLDTFADHFSSLLPHVERANLLLEKMAALHLKNSHADRVLDRIPMGIVLITPEAKIISRNARGIALLDHVEARHHDGELQFRDSNQQRAFVRALNHVASGDSQGAPVTMGPLNLWISHYGESSVEQLAVYLGHQTFERNVRVEQLMKLYGLTEKEAKLTAQLCNGRASLEEAAGNLGMSIGTARTHLKKVFSKTGAQRQADLVKMVLINPILTMQRREPAKQKNMPLSRDTQIARLPSGRTVSYAEHGDPKGKPLLFCHAITGSRLMLPPESGLLAGKGLRLIVPDRAGYGLSSPAITDPMAQWLEDMRHFIPHLGLSRCCVLGHSAGGAYAIALAEALPEMVEHLCLISSVAPMRKSTDTKHLLPVNRMIIQLARSNPVAARSFLKLSMQVALKKPDAYFDLITNSIPDLDKEVLNNTRLKLLLLTAFKETTRQGVDHLIEELMYLSTQWRVDSEKISCLISIWHGKEDRHAPFPLMQNFSRSLKQCAQTNWMDGAGHYMIFHHWDTIMEKIHPKKKSSTSLLSGMLGLITSLQIMDWLPLLVLDI